MTNERADRTPTTNSFLSAGTFANPYPLAAHLRDTDPVHWSGEFHAWVLTRYSDVAAALHDPRLAADRLPQLNRLPDLGYESLAPLFATMRRMFLFVDGADHARLRRLANRTFTRPHVERWRADVQRLVDGLLDRVEPAATMDVLADLARPLPLAVISLVLGLPDDARPRLAGWSERLAEFFGNFLHTTQQLAAHQESMLEFSSFVRALIEERRRGDGTSPDLLTALVRDGGETLTDDEIVANTILIVGAGHVTTTDLIGNGTLALLRHPEQARAVARCDPATGFLDGAVEELLRYDSPVQMSARLARAPVEIGGRTIRPGQWVILWLGAGNRDPARFTEPDRLDLARSDNRHLAFGGGAHFCLGAPLARLQAQVAIPALLQRFPDLRLQDRPLQWEHNPTLRGLTALPVDLDH